MKLLTTLMSVTAFASVLLGNQRTITVVVAESEEYTSPQRLGTRETVPSEADMRVVTGYTLGRVEETDSTPCVGAWGDDLCEINKKGVQTFSSN